MGIFGKKPTDAEIKAFRRGGRGSAKAAEAYAKKAHARETSPFRAAKANAAKANKKR